ncbi:hypothetical protein [Curtobacterium sp. MCBD17_021]|uniref:hypothetical protein n=1 Tax=Curtobacterium sp. MCBD17_021 TaxID=2175665 RepID=UPI000DA74FE8|nr:hypothetical protein [Curtobacterium sp. MCBD17_021]PZE62622.1 hypothetical protein DEI83_15330 [Curtobacterium sp. MCBD17_021]
MQWWNDLIDWTSSETGWRVLSGAVIPFVAILVAGIIAALIGRGAVKRIVAHQEREARNAAVAGLVSAARKAASWGSLGHDERAYADHLAEDADIRLRLLPIAGAPVAADWAKHEIADIKKNSSTFTSHADNSLAEFRDRMLEWQARPNRARKLFKSDLERWKFDSPDPDADLITRQQEWNADRVDSSRAPEPAPTPTTTSLRPAQPSVTPAQPSVTPAQPSASPAQRSTIPQQPSADPARSSVHPGQADGTAMAPTSGHDATVPIGDDATRPYSDGETTPIRPTLGSPAFRAPAVSPGSNGGGWSASRDADNDDVVDDVRIGGADRPGPDDRAASGDRSPVRDEQDRRDASPRAHGFGSTTTTTDPRGAADGTAVPADADETSGTPYANPVSASELRRRADSDDE